MEKGGSQEPPTQTTDGGPWLLPPAMGGEYTRAARPRTGNLGATGLQTLGHPGNTLSPTWVVA